MNIEKKDFENLIRKYNLNGLVENIIINFESDSINCKFQHESKSLLGNINVKKNIYGFEGSIGIMRVSVLKSILSVLDSKIDIQIDNVKNQIELSDSQGVNSLFILSVLDQFDPVPSVKVDPDPLFEVDMNSVITNKIVKIIRAFSSEYFTIAPIDGTYKIVVGYSQNKTNRISVDLGIPSGDNTNYYTYKSELFLNSLAACDDTNIKMAFAISPTSESKAMLSLFCQNDEYDISYRMTNVSLG